MTAGSLGVVRVVGVDPGPIPGVAMLVTGAGRTRAAVFQCNADAVLTLLGMLLDSQPAAALTVLAVEQFIVGRRAARSAAPGAGMVTREMVGAVARLGDALPGIHVVRRAAHDVMRWATDERLDAAGLLSVTRGMPHARAASRHALYAAVRDGNLPDPLSSKVRAP